MRRLREEKKCLVQENHTLSDQMIDFQNSVHLGGLMSRNLAEEEVDDAVHEGNEGSMSHSLGNFLRRPSAPGVNECARLQEENENWKSYASELEYKLTTSLVDQEELAVLRRHVSQLEEQLSQEEAPPTFWSGFRFAFCTAGRAPLKGQPPQAPKLAGA